MTITRRNLLAGAAGLAAAGAAHGALAQLAPGRAMTLMVPYPAGGLSDAVVDKDHRALARVADRMVIMSKGEIAFDGTPAALRADPSILDKHLGV